MDLENHSSKSPPLLTFLFYNTSCVSLISFSNIFSNTLLPLSSGYVHPRPITAVNHKGKHWWRKLYRIFAFVSQSDTGTGGCEIRGNIRHLPNHIDNRRINMQRHVPDWFWVNLSFPTCLHLKMVIQGWLLLMQWPQHFTLGMRLNFALFACVKKVDGW